MLSHCFLQVLFQAIEKTKFQQMALYSAFLVSKTLDYISSALDETLIKNLYFPSKFVLKVFLKVFSHSIKFKLAYS